MADDIASAKEARKSMEDVAMRRPNMQSRLVYDNGRS